MASFDASALAASVRAAGRAVVQWANPALVYESRATRGWPLIELDAALLVALCYGVIVLAGLLRYQTPAPRAPPAKGAAKAEAASWAQRSAAEPILYAMQVYNLAQVLLCGYMIYGAATEALSKGYKPICNAFVPSAKGMASILWVFYVSKVRGGGGAAHGNGWGLGGEEGGGKGDGRRREARVWCARTAARLTTAKEGLCCGWRAAAAPEAGWPYAGQCATCAAPPLPARPHTAAHARHNPDRSLLPLLPS